MALLVMITLCVISLIRQKSKKIAVLICIYMWFFYSFNTYSGDYISYAYVYDSIGKGMLLEHFEPAFSLLMIISNKFGLPFMGFKTILGTFYIILLYITVEKYTDRVAFVLGIFLIFPFMYFVSVLRAGISGLIVVYSMGFLLENNRKNTLKYLFGIMISVLFHYSSVFFILFLFARKRVNGNWIIKILCIMVVMAYIYSQGILYQVISLVTDNQKVLQWFECTTLNNFLNWKGRLAELIVFFAFIYVPQKSFYILHSFVTKEGRAEEYDREIKFQLLVKNCNFIMILLLPFLFFTDVYMRMLWEIFLINICASANIVTIIRKTHFQKIKGVVSVSNMLLIALVVVLNFYTSLPYLGTDISGIYMFRNNLFFQFFNL